MNPRQAIAFLKERERKYPYPVGVPLDSDIGPEQYDKTEALTPNGHFIRVPIHVFNVAIWAFDTEEARNEFLTRRFGPNHGEPPT